MKTILVPIDFSKLSENTFDYAVEIVKKTGDKMVLLHVTHPEIESNAAAVNKLETQLLNLCLLVAHRAGTESSFAVKSGDVNEQIAEVALEKNADLIIMGQSNVKSFSKILFGSNSLNTLTQVPIPVLIIPATCRFSPLKTVTYATNYLVSDIPKVRYVTDFFKNFKSQINLLHISEEDISENTEKQMESFKKTIESNADYPFLSFQIMSGTDVSVKLKDYLSTGAADMLIISTHINPHWHKLFDQSITNDIIYEPTLPVLAFHYKKDASVKLFT